MAAHRYWIILGVLTIGLVGCSEERKREAARLERLASGDSTALEDTLIAGVPDDTTSSPLDSTPIVPTEPPALPTGDSQALVAVNQPATDPQPIAAAESLAGSSQAQAVVQDTAPDVNAIPQENGQSTESQPTGSDMPRRPVSVYTVQVGSAGTKAEASSSLARYRQDGYEPYIATVTSGGRDLYRIRIGKCATQQEAIRLRDELGTRYGIQPWVDKISE